MDSNQYRLMQLQNKTLENLIGRWEAGVIPTLPLLANLSKKEMVL